ncbi:class II aldolase/adducin family protein [Pseudonocardia kunmingensis]|uniref:L-fuculose 1-phosphate aldolase n=1 Tax=Pseudonocardia kunmingensis TaxID=630975 RepID=A0A543DNC8_9PSEU|nr:class II aldolase/adducin family protein [Pseudonocardia kunmingensis]TQM10841.1 L-fuculose 1-phosphate aldolase [Pseudonocardia kunmingensis]
MSELASESRAQRDALDDARRQVAECGRRMVADGLVLGTAGNVSVRVGELVAVSPSGTPYDRIEPQDVSVVDLAGQRVDGPHAPSSETPMHLAIYARTGAGAIVHHHGLHSAAVSTVVDELPALHYYVLQLGGPVRVASYATYGTPELARSVRAALEGRTAALMQNHGAVAHGDTLETAYDRARLVEWLCALHVMATGMGSPRVLSGEELAAVARRRTGNITEVPA